MWTTLSDVEIWLSKFVIIRYAIYLIKTYLKDKLFRSVFSFSVGPHEEIFRHEGRIFGSIENVVRGHNGISCGGKNKVRDILSNTSVNYITRTFNIDCLEGYLVWEQRYVN